MSKLMDTTLLFLVQESGGKISKICLAMKKRGFGQGRWNGTGGKVKGGETILAATRRETLEEIRVKAQKMEKVAELSFFFSHNCSWNQKVHVYFCSQWEKWPSESEEMKPRWFSTDRLPYKKMWPDDIFWLPLVLKGKFVKAKFIFGEGDIVTEKEIVAANRK